MKSYVRIKAFVGLIPLAIGILQLFDYVPWNADEPLMAGFLIISVVGLMTASLPCERCGVSLVSPLLNMEGKETRKVIELQEALKAKGHRLFPYRKKCVHCGLERH